MPQSAGNYRFSEQAGDRALGVSIPVPFVTYAKRSCRVSCLTIAILLSSVSCREKDSALLCTVSCLPKERNRLIPESSRLNDLSRLCIVSWRLIAEFFLNRMSLMSDLHVCCLCGPLNCVRFCMGLNKWGDFFVSYSPFLAVFCCPGTLFIPFLRLSMRWLSDVSSLTLEIVCC